MCKKIISFLLTLMMVSAMVSIPAMAEDSSASTPTFGDEVVIADFTKIEDINNAEMEVDSEDKLFGDKSGKISQAKLDAKNVATGYFEIDSTKAPTDWSSYTYLNLWVYSAEVTDLSFAVIIRSPGTSGNSAWSVQKQDFTGWKKISVPLSTIGKGGSFSISNVQDTYVSLEFSGINNVDGVFDRTRYKKLSFAKIWLSTETENVTDVTKEVYTSYYNASNPGSTTATKLAGGTASLTTASVENHNYSLRIKDATSGTTGGSTRQWAFDGGAEDWSSYNYINLRIQNGNTDAEGNIADGYFQLRLYSNAGGWWCKPSGTHSVTGNEWYTLSIKMSDEFTHSTDSTNKTFNDVYGLWFTYVNGPLYIEKIWLSTEDPNAPVVAPELVSTSISGGDEVSAYTHNIDFTYSKALDSDVAPTVTVAPEADYVVACENDTVQVIFPKALAAKTQYTVTVGGVSDADASVTFSTDNYSVGRSDTAVYARYASDEHQSGQMIIAVYSEDGNLEKIDVIKDADSTDGVLTLTNDYLSVDIAQNVKIFVWDNFGTSLKPFEKPQIFE